MQKSTQLTKIRSRKPRAGTPSARGHLSPYCVLACDADGTLTWRHHLAGRTAAALVRWRGAGGRVILVTGETRGDLLHFARTGLFDRIVGENGGVILRPPDWRDHALGPAPSPSTVRALRRCVRPLRVGRVILGTEKVNERSLRRIIGPGHQLIRNGKDVMALPAGVTKASGLAAALKDLGVPAEEVVGIGNAENDLALIRGCGLRVAVVNALPRLKRRVDWVVAKRGPDGVIELIRRLLAGRPPKSRRH